MRKFRLISGLIPFILFVSAAAQYRSEVWTTENGLPQNSITAILQSKDGYIWFGTFGGLVRFDGIKFKIFNTINAPAIKTNRITGLYEDKNGTLWIGTQYGNVISYKDDVFTSVLEPPTIPRAAIFTICIDDAGAIWTFGGGVLQKFAADASGKYAAEKISLPNEETPFFGSVVRDDANNIWISTVNALYKFQNGVFQTFPFRDLFPQNKNPQGNLGSLSPKILIDRQKRIWLIGNGLLARFENGGIVPIFRKPEAYFGFVENADGSFFLKSEDKVYRFANDKLQDLLIDEPKIFLALRVMMSDREGNLWIGGNGNGLLRYKQQTARTYLKADGLSDGAAFFIFEDRDKNLWIGADKLYKFRNGKF